MNNHRIVPSPLIHASSLPPLLCYNHRSASLCMLYVAAFNGLRSSAEWHLSLTPLCHLAALLAPPPFALAHLSPSPLSL